LVAEGFLRTESFRTNVSLRGASYGALLRGRAEEMEETPSAMRLDKNKFEAYTKR